jgi:prepilin-type N-terminal cleavage/methylation domain-containing protein
MDGAGMGSGGRSSRGFTLIEVLVVITVILILIAALMPAAHLIHNQALRGSALHLVSELSSGFDEYRAEDALHLYPTPPAPGQDAAHWLEMDPAHPTGVLMLLQCHSAYVASAKDLDQNANDPWHLCLVDPWGDPYLYQLDGGYIAPGPPAALDTHLMNHQADRPVAAIGTVAQAIAPTWNAAGKEPFAYLWSIGVPTGNGFAADTQPANWRNWIYVPTSQ